MYKAFKTIEEAIACEELGDTELFVLIIDEEAFKNKKGGWMFYNKKDGIALDSFTKSEAFKQIKKDFLYGKSK